MADDKEVLQDILWKMFEENSTVGRHHEIQRATVTNLVIIVAAGVLGLVTFDKSLTRADLPLTSFLIALGVFGAIFSSKHYERFQLHTARARFCRDLLDELLPSINTLLPQASVLRSKLIEPSNQPLRVAKISADKAHESEFPQYAKRRISQAWLRFIYKRRLHQLWLSFHLIIALLGLVLSVLAIFWPQRAA